MSGTFGSISKVLFHYTKTTLLTKRQRSGGIKIWQINFYLIKDWKKALVVTFVTEVLMSHDFQLLYCKICKSIFIYHEIKFFDWYQIDHASLLSLFHCHLALIILDMFNWIFEKAEVRSIKVSPFYLLLGIVRVRTIFKQNEVNDNKKVLHVFIFSWNTAK